MQHTQAGPGQTGKSYQYAAPYSAPGPQGPSVSYKALITKATLRSLSPGQWLVDLAVDMYMYRALDVLLQRSGADARVVPSGMFREWQDWATRKPGSLVPDSARIASSEPPTSLLKTNLTGTDHLLFAWSHDGHYSTVLIWNAGNARIPWTSVQRVHPRSPLPY